MSFETGRARPCVRGEYRPPTPMCRWRRGLVRHYSDGCNDVRDGFGSPSRATVWSGWRLARIGARLSTNPTQECRETRGDRSPFLPPRDRGGGHGAIHYPPMVPRRRAWCFHAPLRHGGRLETSPSLTCLRDGALSRASAVGAADECASVPVAPALRRRDETPLGFSQ